MFEPFLGFFFKIEVIESVWINYGHVLGDLWVTLLVDVTFLSWDSEHDVFVLNASVDQTLNDCIDIQSATINNTLRLSASVSQLLHQRS